MGGGKRGQTQSVSIDALLNRAVAAHRRGDLTETERLCRRVLARRPHRARRRAAARRGALGARRLGRCHRAVRRGGAARRRARRAATSASTTTTRTRCGRGKRYGQAEVILRQIVGVEPRSWQAWHNLGQVLKDSERYDEALAPLRRAVALAPEHGPNHAVLGEVLYHVGRLRSADAVAPPLHRPRLRHRRESLDAARQHPAPAR